MTRREKARKLMTRQEKAIKIILNMYSLNKHWCEYALLYNGKLSKWDYFEKYKNNKLMMWDCEWKVYNKLYPIIYNNK